MSSFFICAGSAANLRSRIGVAVATITALSLPAAAQTLSGRVVDAQGHGVAGVDLDLKSQNGGGDPTLSQDFTDANGYFTTSVTPAGTYRIELIPPAPPASTSMYLRLDDVVVTGATNLGVIALPQGVALTGRCVDNAGVPIPGINLDVSDASGANLDLVHDTTNVLGQFAIAVPSGALRVDFDTTPVLTAMFAPRRLELQVSGATNVGDVVHPPGYLLSAFVKRQSNNTAVVGVDVDVVDSSTKALLYTPGDDSDALGFIDTIVPAGVYDVRFDAPAGSGLVSAELPSRTVSANTFLGTLLLQGGFPLSGTVTSVGGAPQVNVDVDVRSATTGVSVYLGPDNTNASGFYSVVVPAGTYVVEFSPLYSVPLAGVQFANVVVNSAKSQNAVLPACPFFATVGVGSPGLGGVVPQLSASGGTPRVGNDAYTVHASHARGGTLGIVFYSLNPASNPLPSPMQPQAPMQRRIVAFDGAVGAIGVGDASFSLPIPQNPLLAGNLLRVWFRIRDGAATGGLSSTNELRTTICF